MLRGFGRSQFGSGNNSENHVLEVRGVWRLIVGSGNDSFSARSGYEAWGTSLWAPSSPRFLLSSERLDAFMA